MSWAWQRRTSSQVCSPQDYRLLSGRISAVTKFTSTGKLPQAGVKLDISQHRDITESLTTCGIYIIFYVFKASLRHYLQLRGLVSQAGTLFSISSHGISDNRFCTCARNAIKIDMFGGSTARMLLLQTTVSKE